jgi:hypothetical protein
MPIPLQVLRQISFLINYVILIPCLTLVLIPCLTLVETKLYESRAELELLINLNVGDYVKPEFEKS